MLEAFLRCDKAEVALLYSHIEDLDFEVEDGFQYMLFISCELLFNYSCHSRVDSKLMKDVSDFAVVYYAQKRKFMRVEYILLDFLILTGCYSVVKDMSEKISFLTPMHRLQYAYALLKQKNTSKATEIYTENINSFFDNIPQNSFYYVMLKCCRISYCFTKNKNFKKLGEFFSQQTGAQYYTDVFEKM